jgi:hypothetical protein
VTCKAGIINIAEYSNTILYIEDQFVNIKSHESDQQNMNSTITVAAKVAEELNQSNENIDTKKAFNAQKQNWESP